MRRELNIKVENADIQNNIQIQSKRKKKSLIKKISIWSIVINTKTSDVDNTSDQGGVIYRGRVISTLYAVAILTKSYKRKE